MYGHMNIKLAAMYPELYSHWNTHACTCVGQCFPDHLWRVAFNRHRYPVLLMVKQRYHFTASWITDHMYKEDEWKGISVPNRSNHRVLDMLVVPKLVKKFPVFYETERFINMFTIASHWSAFCQMNPSTTSHLISLRTSNLRLSSKQTFSFRRFNQNRVCVSFLSHMCHKLSISISECNFLCTV